MKKHFFLTFKSTLSMLELLDILQNKLQIDFVLHESMYLGEYYAYKGLLCESFKIFDNKMPDHELHLDEAGIMTILKLSFIEGKNKDKEIKCLRIKNQLESIMALNLHSFEILED